LHKQGLLAKNAGWLKFLFKLCIALVAIGIIFYYGAHQHDWLELKNTPFIRIVWLSLWLALAGGVYLGTLWLTGFRVKDFLYKAT
jgi:putative peptidoglycan lipid II flippase